MSGRCSGPCPQRWATEATGLRRAARGRRRRAAPQAYEDVMPTALITGITGQDGSYLAEFLLTKGYRVVGMVRRTSIINLERLESIQDRVTLVQGDLLDEASMIGVLREFAPQEVYNLAAMSFVPTSWQ